MGGGVRVAMLVGVIVMSACGRTILDDPVGEIPAASTPFADAASARADASITTADASRTAFGCVAGDPDQVCNDDPAVSALWGTCLPSGGCLCNDGFSYDAATGKCRFGSLCLASGADPWVFSTNLGLVGCASRPAATCVASSNYDALQATVGTLLMSACGLPPLIYVRVVFGDGCPTLVEMKPAVGAAPLDPALTSCVSKALAQQRWSCAEPTGCALVEWDTLP
jgi:hypothetical protein